MKFIQKKIVYKQLIKNRKIFFVATSLAFICILIAVLVATNIIKAKGNDDCLTCHDDKDLTMDKNGKKVSIYVNGNQFKTSMHKGIECTDCHQDYNAEVLPHNPKKKDIDCKLCHDNVKSGADNVHNNVKCYDCHSGHNVISAKEFAKNESGNCMSCHKNKNVQKFKGSIHDKNNLKCNACHQGGHNVKKIERSEVVNLCGKCHSKDMQAYGNSIHQIVLKKGTGKAPTCIDCHGSHEILKNKMDIESQSCLKCHLDEKMFPGEGVGSAKFVAKYKTSIHTSIEKDGHQAAGCSDCHGNHMIQNPDNPKGSTTRLNLPETCGKCHKDIVDKFLTSAHGKALLNKQVSAPTCISCHSEHSIKAVRKTDEFSKINQVEMCLKCHIDWKLPHKNYKGEEVLITNYKDSYHYTALKNGNLNAATCSDCHGSHEMNKFDNPNSKIYKKNVEKTCGQSGCHVKQLNEYTGSIHEESLAKDNMDSPTCTDCHGRHQILKKDDGTNRISNPKGLVQLCSSCHSSVEMTKKYNLPVRRTETYLESFHGLAVRGGSNVAANCESCHGYHNIRPSSDSLSTIYKKNLPKTCGKCHPGALETLFNTSIHNTGTKEDSPIIFWITRFYIFLIILTIGGMGLHNLIDLIKKVQKNKAHKV